MDFGFFSSCEELMQRLGSTGDQGAVAVVPVNNDPIVAQLASFEAEVDDEAVLQAGHDDVAPFDQVVGVELNQNGQEQKEQADCVDHQPTRKLKKTVVATMKQALQSKLMYLLYSL